MRALILALAVLAPVAAVAQDPSAIDRSATYGTREDCGEGDGEGLVLDFTRGIEGIEYHCDFFEIKASENSIFLFVEAVCEAPGIRNPDLLSIAPYDDKSIEVVSLYEAMHFPPTEDNPTPGTQIYYRCN